MTATGPWPTALHRLVPPRRRAAWLLVAAVLAVHVLLLDRWPGAPGPDPQAQARQALQVRHIPVAAAADRDAEHDAARQTASAAGAGAGAAVQTVPRTATPNTHDGPVWTDTAAAPPRTVPRPRPLMTASAAAAASTASATPAPSEAPAAAPAAPAAALPDAGGPPLPVYRTQLPPPLALSYAWHRGGAQGTATLDWRPGPERYTLTLQGQAPGIAALGWASQGAFDEAGIAPLRYVESRRGREARAANFQRDRGFVSFSGPATEHRLPPGAQDRLSWLVQLAGVLAADPSLGLPGSSVQLWVAGARGDASAWTFTVQGRPALPGLPIGALADTVHLLRESGGPYDTQVQVWLDPARHHLPVQVHWRVRATGEGMSLALQALAP